MLSSPWPLRSVMCVSVPGFLKEQRTCNSQAPSSGVALLYLLLLGERTELRPRCCLARGPCRPGLQPDRWCILRLCHLLAVRPWWVTPHLCASVSPVSDGVNNVRMICCRDTYSADGGGRGVQGGPVPANLHILRRLDFPWLPLEKARAPFPKPVRALFLGSHLKDGENMQTPGSRPSSLPLSPPPQYLVPIRKSLLVPLAVDRRPPGSASSVRSASAPCVLRAMMAEESRGRKPVLTVHLHL